MELVAISAAPQALKRTLYPLDPSLYTPAGLPPKVAVKELFRKTIPYNKSQYDPFAHF
ncbi:hypothetical protein [Arenibacter amylolyticus]|uniref:hypothetical protein n=1 Tax=Arenibacter amylolyticus TaxID=1406873 RepID=UPI001593ADF8|nr:hypothetical protein [Arenibacter amylolyticus]